jgi:hypothetical protein
MPRRPRVATSGLAYDVRNHAAGEMTLLELEGHYAEFERCLEDVHERGMLTNCPQRHATGGKEMCSLIHDRHLKTLFSYQRKFEEG